MSLKNFIRKSIASTMALSLLFGNCSMCGLGISQVIAENLTAPEVIIEFVNDKFVEYKKEIETKEVKTEEIGQVEEGKSQETVTTKEISGVAIESKLSIYSNQNQDTYMPIESVEIGVNLPRINDTLPEKALVVEASTRATTGEELNKNINQNYDSDSGLLTITYENIPNQEENIYSEFVENAKDEFKIIYSYSEQAYTEYAEGEEKEEIELEYDINAKMNFKAENESLISNSSNQIKLIEKDNVGDILNLKTDIKEEDLIYKGFIYSNVENKTNYDTEFNTVSTFAVLNTAVLDETVEMEILDSKFMLDDEDETEIETNGNVVYKSTQIRRDEFDTMIGKEGHIEIYNGETTLAVVRYIDTDDEDEETNELCVILSDGRIEMIEDSNDINITYPEDISSLKIKMSKPLTEGYIHFRSNNAIKASEDYGCKVEDIKYIVVGTKVDMTTRYTEKELSEPNTEIGITASNTSFSTLKANQTTLTVRLNDTNSSVKLFDNPVITITLPKGLTAGNVSSPTIVNGNGLKIKNTKVDDNVITIELEGKQTSYDINNITGGATIVMDIENLRYSDTTPSRSDKIIVTCLQNEETTTAECNVNILSKAGLLVMSKLSNYNEENTTTTVLGGVNNKTVEISKDEGRVVVNTLNLVNNYDANLANVQIIGRIDYSDANLKTTFATNLTKPIEVNDKNVKVYYSTNANANYNDEGWSQEYNENAKTIKVVFNNNEIATATAKAIKAHLNVPANLGYNQENYIKWEVLYTYNETNIKSSTTVGMLTEKNNLNIDSTNPDENENTGDNIQNSNKIEVKLGTYGQDYGPAVEKEIEYNANDNVEYVIKVKNLTDSKLRDIKILHNIQEAQGVLNYKIGGIAKFDKYEGYLVKEEIPATNNKFEYTIKTLNANEEIEFVVVYTVGKLESVYSADVTTDVTANLDDEVYKSNSKTIKLLQSAFTISMSSNISEEQILKPGDSVTYTININNIGKTTSGVDFEDIIPNQIKVNKIEYGQTDEELNTTNTLEQNIKLFFRIGVGQKEIVKITGIVIEQEVEETTIVDVSNIAKIIYGGEDIQSNEVKVKMQFEPVQEDPIDPPEEPTEPEEPDQPEEPEGERMDQGPVQPDDFEPSKPGDNDENDEQQPDDNGGNADQQPDDNDRNEEQQPGDDNENQDPKPDDNTPEEVYSISGYAWLDQNKDGKKDDNESIQENIKVILVNKDIGNFALDKEGNRIITTTDNTGKYTFSNIVKGNYLILFEFDTNKYTVTTYRKTGVEEIKNSDALLTTVTIDGVQKLVGATDSIELKANIEDINIGLMENAIFDLSLNKQITEITVKNAKGTETYTYDEGDTAKVDLVAKYMNGAKVTIKYKFTIKNEGEVTGYVESLLDEIPEGLDFNEDLNENWTKGKDGKLYYTALSGTGIKQGETKEVELILTKTMTEESTGVFPNSAKLEKISNLENIQEKEEAIDNNQSSAMLIISIKTGTIFMYIGLTFLCASIILTGTYFIKKKVLSAEI